MKGRAIPYSAAELRWIEAHRTDVRSVAHAAFNKKFRRRVSFDNFKALYHRKGWTSGRNGRFTKGIVPHNKGKRCPEGKGGRHPNARRSQFKKGQLPLNTKYLGHERVSKDGYVKISVAERNPHTGYERRYVLKHKHLWEKKHGPVRKGKCLKCLDGNLQNTDPSNWKLIARGVNAILNRKHNGLDYETAPAHLKPSILALAELKHASSAKRRGARG